MAVEQIVSGLRHGAPANAEANGRARDKRVPFDREATCRAKSGMGRHISLVQPCRSEHTEAVSSIGVSGPKDGFRLDRLWRNSGRDFLPLTAAPSFLAAQ